MAAAMASRWADRLGSGDGEWQTPSGAETEPTAAQCLAGAGIGRRGGQGIQHRVRSQGGEDLIAGAGAGPIHPRPIRGLGRPEDGEEALRALLGDPLAQALASRHPGADRLFEND